ncbi:protein arginine N-methyltransferase 5 isoform X1 [Bacillus rossius redtenbacheri]|uniref:protein arginine N-methyltransferase 5 isoform X1 n=1 Tax=Bacillus rossius redtenbacheri TaxID=93214 RepID=UPI002FDE32EB
MMSSRKLSCGMDLCSVADMRKSLQYASDTGFDFVCLPIVHPRFKREFIKGKAKNRDGAFTRSELVLVSTDWVMTVGKLSPYIDVDCGHEVTRKLSVEALNQELQYAHHLGMPAVMLTLRGGQQVNLARILHNKIQAGCIYQIWLHLRMESTASSVQQYYSSGVSEDSSAAPFREDTWEWWNEFRGLCNFDKKLALALELTPDIPSKEEVDRWLGEPIKCLIVPTSLFVANKKNFPVLLKPHQSLLRSFASLDVQVVVKGAVHYNNVMYYQQYLDHIWQQRDTTGDPLLSFARGYEDFLQCPLQPLSDNLETHTYEVFEKDPVKYNEYERAIYCALVDRIPYAEKDEKEFTVMVVGAGRGPLVRAAISAAYKAERRIKVYAVEKNPNAVVSLQAQKEELWKDKVTVVSCDMREFDPPEKADILISELLGSFGDNELSPECLDGAQKFLKDDGISIPMSYTSYLCPIQSSKLYNEVRLSREKDDRERKCPVHPFEMPYVVYLQNKYQLAETQKLFTFTHPNRDEIIDNSRYKCLSFKVSQKSILHGFSGFFDTILYQNTNVCVSLSICPATHTEGMFSWFPILFPIREPVHLQAGDDIKVHFWRLCNKKNVWYEWCVSKPIPGPIHNPNGRSYTIGL